jgi:heme exporter protein D
MSLYEFMCLWTAGVLAVACVLAHVADRRERRARGVAAAKRRHPSSQAVRS